MKENCVALTNAQYTYPTKYLMIKLLLALIPLEKPSIPDQTVSVIERELRRFAQSCQVTHILVVMPPETLTRAIIRVHKFHSTKVTRNQTQKYFQQTQHLSTTDLNF